MKAIPLRSHQEHGYNVLNKYIIDTHFLPAKGVYDKRYLKPTQNKIK
jgi:hypothetical protein